jgi:hypothetical protein
MTAISKVVSLLVISVALTLSSSYVFAKNEGPGQAKSLGTSAAPSGSSAGGSQDKTKGCSGHSRGCPPKPGTTQPTCHGPHMGPNGVMIQCQ